MEITNYSEIIECSLELTPDDARMLARILENTCKWDKAVICESEIKWAREMLNGLFTKESVEISPPNLSWKPVARAVSIDTWNRWND